MDYTPSCPAMAVLGDGAETIDLLCWLQVGHPGLHEDVRAGDGDSVMWVTKSEQNAVQ